MEPLTDGEVKALADRAHAIRAMIIEMLVAAGSAIAKSADPAKAYRSLQKLARSTSL